MIKKFSSNMLNRLFAACVFYMLTLLIFVSPAKADFSNLDFNEGSAIGIVHFNYKGREYFAGQKDLMIEEKNDEGKTIKRDMWVTALFDGEKYIYLAADERLRNIDCVCSDGERLFGIDVDKKTVYELALEGENASIADEILTSDLIEWDDINYNKACVIAGKIYLLKKNELESFADNRFSLIELDISSKTARNIDIACSDFGKMAGDRAYFVKEEMKSSIFSGSQRVFSLFALDVNSGETKK